MIQHSDLAGIEMPGHGGDEGKPYELKVLGFADDLCVFLKDTKGLDKFRELLSIYEKGAGAVNSWEKTHGMRIGSLRASDELWAEMPSPRCLRETFHRRPRGRHENAGSNFQQNVRQRRHGVRKKGPTTRFE